MEYKKKNNIPYITIAIIIVNVIAFEICRSTGSIDDMDHMIDMGAMYGPLVTQAHEYYRIITHFFLHFGLDHLGNNMFSLIILGYALESQMGRVRYLSIYFLSGILAGIASIVYNIYCGQADMAVSCGASGAIYGLMGALLAVLIFEQRQQARVAIPRFAVYVAISIYSGMMDHSIDNAAHIGGFVAGFLVCGITSIFCKKKSDRILYR